MFLFGGAAVASAIQQDDLFPPLVFSIFFIVSLIGSLNMIMWKLEVYGDEITWRSTFGRKKIFRFEDITYCEMKGNSIRVYVNDKKLFTIDSGIDDSEFMEEMDGDETLLRDTGEYEIVSLYCILISILLKLVVS